MGGWRKWRPPSIGHALRWLLFKVVGGGGGEGGRGGGREGGEQRMVRERRARVVAGGDAGGGEGGDVLGGLIDDATLSDDEIATTLKDVLSHPPTIDQRSIRIS